MTVKGWPPDAQAAITLRGLVVLTAHGAPARGSESRNYIGCHIIAAINDRSEGLVNYADLNVHSPAGAAILNRRIFRRSGAHSPGTVQRLPNRSNKNAYKSAA
jgi:hypothetical protein